ncbi:peroxiredoxin [soil metagenome]
MRRFALLAALALAASPAFATLPPGAVAPDFKTRGAIAGKEFKLHLKDQLRHGPVVLYFFPAAFTGGCNAEAHAFAEAIGDFRAAGATVIGMSTDPVKILADFSTQKCAGQFPVASAGPGIVKAYDVGSDQTHTASDGVTRSITTRTSYVIAPDGRVTYVHSERSFADHVKNTLAAVQALKKG